MMEIPSSSVNGLQKRFLSGGLVGIFFDGPWPHHHHNFTSSVSYVEALLQSRRRLPV